MGGILYSNPDRATMSITQDDDFDSAGADAEPISIRILMALERAAGTSSLDFEQPLYEAVDPDALDALFRDGTFDGRVSFTYLGRRIVVEGPDRISVREE